MTATPRRRLRDALQLLNETELKLWTVATEVCAQVKRDALRTGNQAKVPRLLTEHLRRLDADGASWLLHLFELKEEAVSDGPVIERLDAFLNDE